MDDPRPPVRRVSLLRVGLALGGAIDLYVGCLAIFAPRLIPTLLDIPLHDPSLARVAGGEYVVAACAYAVAFRSPRRFWPLLWICVLDQLFAVVLPALEIASGGFPATWKTVAPIPLDAALAVLFAVCAVRLARRDRARVA